MAKSKNVISTEESLFKELSQLIEQSQQQLILQANSTLTMLFWNIGKRINESILNNKRADYGKQIVVTLSRQLSWSHILAILPLKKVEAKLFYANSVSINGLGVRELRKAISAKEFERTSIANLQNSSNNPAIYNSFKDPYFLDFLGLQDTYLEKDLEEAILRELEAFILELLCKGSHNISYAYRFIM
jgi:predicted nuclease of restriction endonuclease-like (RecB) superfamily